MNNYASRQWYRLSVNNVLNLLDSSNEKSANKPYFLPKNTWHLYKYHNAKKASSFITADSLRIGDVIMLNKGDIVPATIRLTSVNNLRVQEQYVFGNASMIHKNTFASKSLLPQSQQKNMLFPKSEIISGSCVGVVVQLAQDFMKSSKHVVKKPPAKKYYSLLLQDTKIQDLRSSGVVVFEDLQRIEEITKLFQQLQLRHNVKTVFIVNGTLLEDLEAIFPDKIICKADDINENTVFIKLAKNTNEVLHKLNIMYGKVLFVYRGESYSNYSHIAANTLVFSRYASQQAMYYSDAISDSLTVSMFSSILYNKK
jgi:hypothetical protein